MIEMQERPMQRAIPQKQEEMNSEGFRTLIEQLQQQQAELMQQQKHLYACQLELQKSMHIYEEQAQFYHGTDTVQKRRQRLLLFSHENSRHRQRESQ